MTCPGSGWIHANDKWLYTRSGALASGQDSLMYDLCRVAIAFANTDSSQLVGVNSIGNLWAEYEVCFDGPKTSELVPSVTFSSALDALTSEEYLPVGDAVLNGGPNGPWTKVNFRAGTANAVYVPDLFAATNPGEYSGIVISQAGYYKITTQMYFFEPSPATTSYWPNAWQADGEYQISDEQQFYTEGPIPMSTIKFAERIQFGYVPTDDSIVTESGDVVGSSFFKVNGGVGEPTNEDIEGYIAKIIIWVEAVELSELQLLGVTDIALAAPLSIMAKKDKFTYVNRDRTFSSRKFKQHKFVPPASHAASSVPVEEPECEEVFNPPMKKC